MMDYKFDYETVSEGATLLHMSLFMSMYRVNFIVKTDHLVWVEDETSRTEISIRPIYDDPIPADPEVDKAIAYIINKIGKCYAGNIQFVNHDLPEEQFKRIENELKATGDWVRNGVLMRFPC